MPETARACSCSQLVALLSGINVGGNNRVPMAELRECMTALGATDVATYIQAGTSRSMAPAGRPTTGRRRSKRR